MMRGRAWKIGAIISIPNVSKQLHKRLNSSTNIKYDARLFQSIATAGILVILRHIVTLFYPLVHYASDEPYLLVTAIVIEMSWALLILGLCLTLAVFLLVGIEKRRPGYVLTYLICGTLGTLALAIYWMIMISKGSRYFIYDGAFEIFFVIIVYSLSLTATYFVYRNIKLEKSNNMIYNVLQESGYNFRDVKEKSVV
ncbi:hypothetical protein EVAR_55973_1 [Eumeta japonica]|uniref:Uncharacterized protein n=1 Tax=Eumeta variegata TaxID=151549 RepID=A0A4C1YVC6_EUMVA|nr:hypothetical protein EVAR_55973_1 [Eumeta japonica]